MVDYPEEKVDVTVVGPSYRFHVVLSLNATILELKKQIEKEYPNVQWQELCIIHPIQSVEEEIASIILDEDKIGDYYDSKQHYCYLKCSMKSCWS